MYPAELKEVVIEACHDVGKMRPSYRRDQHMTGMELVFDNREGSFHESPCTADHLVASFLLDGERMIPDCPVHRLILSIDAASVTPKYALSR